MARTTVGSLLRSTQAFCQQLCQKQTLDYGIAYYCERFAELPDANQFREVLIGEPAKIPEAFAQAQAWFSERKLVCHRWAPADGGVMEALADFLTARGFRPRMHLAMTLARWPSLTPPPGIRVLPARALREALRRTYLDDDATPAVKTREMLAESCNERLDDPQLDMFVATIDKMPAGRAALYQVGDIARVMDLTVLPAFLGRGVEHALLAHTLGLAKRLTMPTVLAQVSADAAMHRHWLEEAGFVEDGRLLEFDRSAPGEPVTLP